MIDEQSSASEHDYASDRSAIGDGTRRREPRSGITFDVTLEVPWNAPEASVQLHSDGVFDLEKTVSDVLGLYGRRPDAAVVRVMQSRDARSVHALIPDLAGPGKGIP